MATKRNPEKKKDGSERSAIKEKEGTSKGTHAQSLPEPLRKWKNFYQQ